MISNILPAGQSSATLRRITASETALAVRRDPPDQHLPLRLRGRAVRCVRSKNPAEPTIYVRKSQLARAQQEAPQVQQMAARGIAYLSDYFAQPFPFPKYDLVLIPGFPFGGMEHAGATFLNEDGVLFRSTPTASDYFRRNILVLHETCHQWFGDLVTMRWFDDLWLKEGFAQYMAYKALAHLEPGSNPWKHFYEDIKPLAYGIDETQGTTPIFQNIANLKDAKSAYGAIVYQKAPAVLKQLELLSRRRGLPQRPAALPERTRLRQRRVGRPGCTRSRQPAIKLGRHQDVQAWAACLDPPAWHATGRGLLVVQAGAVSTDFTLTSARRPERRLRLAHGPFKYWAAMPPEAGRYARPPLMLRVAWSDAGPCRPRGHRSGLPRVCLHQLQRRGIRPVPARPCQSNPRLTTR